MGIRLIIIGLLFLSACGPEWPPFDAGPQDMTAVDPTPAPPPIDEESMDLPPGPSPYEPPVPPWEEPEEPWDWLVPRPEPEEPPCTRCFDVLD